MCRATAGPLLAMVGVAGTAAGVAIAIVRERVDRRADARAARLAAEEQANRHVAGASPDEDRADGVGPGEPEPVKSESSESK